MSVKGLSVRETPIPGLLVIDLPLHRDSRGWFKENWQRVKMVAAGLPDFKPCQNNISFNDHAGATRGIHAEPWDKFISVASGSIFGAWVDLREGPTFGVSYTLEVSPDTAVFVPRGVGNGYQTLADDTAYVYLVNDHWSASAQSEYTFLNLADETVAIPWPVPLQDSERSEKDLAHPRLAEVQPMRPKRTLVLGANGQLGRELGQHLDTADFMSRNEVDMGADDPFGNVRWSSYDTVINAAAYTDVDGAESVGGATEAWATNVKALSKLAKIANEHDLTLVHVSSDYVFNGEKTSYSEEDAVSPLGVYGQTKAAGDAIVSSVQRHFIIRTSWVIGDGNNFVRTMGSLADRQISPSVVGDQFGRPSFTEDIVKGILHLLRTGAEYGTYNLTNEGPPVSWAALAQLVFELKGRNPQDVSQVTTATYFEGKAAARRPANSFLDLLKIEASGFTPRDWRIALEDYVRSDTSETVS